MEPGKLMEFLRHITGRGRRAGRNAAETPSPQPLWFDDYEISSEDERFLRGLAGRTLLPTRVRLPSGRTVTGAEVGQWLAAARVPGAR